MAALRSLARETAAAGMNTLMIEWEGTYPFSEHVVISNRHAYTGEELTSFIDYCTRLGLEVIPLQQCFGHVEYILQHERYACLRESESDLCQVCPCKIDEALEVFTEIFRDVAARHPSPFFHIGGDETYLLGHCPVCRAKAEKSGKSKLYVDYFKRVAETVVKLGKRPLLWADMLLKHPAAAAGMPRECVFVDWNYGWPVNRFGDLSQLDKTRYEIWGAPALRSAPDNHSLTCWKTHFENLRDFIPFARTAGYKGMILTSWSTSGVYGYNWDKPGEVIEILPIRRVYPLAGFLILREAFRVALLPESNYEPEAFVINYARERFGFTTRQGASLWKALTLDATPVTPATDLKLIGLKARESKRLLTRLKAKKNTLEFEHLRLMAELREFHVRFKTWEAKLNSRWFTATRLALARTTTSALLTESNALARRFTKLNRSNLHADELRVETDYRFGKLRQLHARLTRHGRS
jgi:hexosaminidase